MGTIQYTLSNTLSNTLSHTKTNKMTHIQFHSTPQSKMDDFVKELTFLSTKFKPFSDLLSAVDMRVVSPKIFAPDENKHGFIVMFIGHNDDKLVEWGEKIGLLRGFPMRWVPDKSLEVFGFRQKFLNDNRAIPIDTVFQQVGGFRKVSGYLGQLVAWETEGELFWTTCSKNSASCDINPKNNMSFASDAARIFEGVVSKGLLREMVDEGIHVCAEMMSKNDAQHGEIPRKDAGVVTTVGKGLRLVKNASGEWEINSDREKGFVDFLGFRDTIAFCLKHNLHVGTAIVANGKAAERFMELLKENRDTMTDSKYQGIINRVKVEFPDDFEEILGNCSHSEVLGEGLEGLVIHATKADETKVIYKLKFPKYTCLTMCLREMLKKLSMKDPNEISDEILKWGNRWCTTQGGKEYWTDYLWSCIFKMDSIKREPGNSIAWHLRLAKTTNDEWDSGDIPTLRSGLKESVRKWISEGLPALREVITVVLPFSRDYSEIEASLEKVGYDFTSEKLGPKKNRGCVLLRDVPQVPNGKTGIVYQLPCPIKHLADWQEKKLSKIDHKVKMVPNLEELVPMIQKDLKEKIPQVKGPSPMETLLQEKNAEIVSFIRQEVDKSDVPLVAMFVAPQCVGKSFLFSKLSDIFDHCSADNYMGEKFNPSMLIQNHAKCAMDVFKALKEGRNALVDNTNMRAEERSIYKTIADFFKARILMIPICEEYWLTGEEVNKDFVRTLVERAEKRERKFDKSPDVIITRTINSGRENFKEHGKTLEDWLYHFPMPNRPTGIYVGRERSLLYRSSEIDSLVKEALQDSRLSGMDEKILEKQIWRGVGESHITLVEPREMKKPLVKKLKEESVKEQMKNPGPITCKGIGCSEKDGEKVYFLVIDWDWGNNFRKNVLGLESPKQFHITLCWTGRGDIHGVDKGPNTLEW